MPGAQKQKLYCYVDETGQDTEGRLFLVSVVVTDAFAGFIRDALEGETYAQELYQEARQRGFVREV